MRMIDAGALIKNIEWNRNDFKNRCPKMRFTVNDAIECVRNAPTIEPKRGEWKFTPRSFYRDEDFPDGVVYVMAHCSECVGKHPNFAEVYHRTILRPEEYECEDGWEFDEIAEQASAMEEAEKRRNKLAPYCPNCGARMDGEP